MKHLPTARQWKLITLLEEAKDGISLKTLTEKLELDERSVRRNLASLKKWGLPIREMTEAHGRKLWQIDKNSLIPPTFNFEEAAALYLGHRSLAPLTNSFLWEAGTNGLQKIRKQLGTQHVQFLDRLLNTFYQSFKEKSDYSEQSEIIEALIFGCEEQKEVTIHYRSNTAPAEDSYTIQPYEFIIREGTFYIVGFSSKRNEIRLWKVNRITFAEATESQFTKPKDFDIGKYIRKGFGVFISNDEPVQKIRINIDKWKARYVQEHYWHETQKFEKQKGGSVIVEFDVVPSLELINWILKFGRHAEVLEPESFRQTVKNEIGKMYRQYQKKGRS
jgi:proteasome accessory factor B